MKSTIVERLKTLQIVIGSWPGEAEGQVENELALILTELRSLVSEIREHSRSGDDVPPTLAGKWAARIGGSE